MLIVFLRINSVMLVLISKLGIVLCRIRMSRFDMIIVRLVIMFICVNNYVV